MTRKKSEQVVSLGATERQRVPTALKATDHAIKRFLERGGGLFTRNTRPFLVRLAYTSARLREAREHVWDTTVKKPVLLLRLLQPQRVHGTDAITLQLSDMVALIREENIVTVLTLPMVVNNKEVGMYFKSDQTPFQSHLDRLKRGT